MSTVPDRPDRPDPPSPAALQATLDAAEMAGAPPEHVAYLRAMVRANAALDEVFGRLEFDRCEAIARRLIGDSEGFAARMTGVRTRTVGNPYSCELTATFEMVIPGEEDRAQLVRFQVEHLDPDPYRFAARCEESGNPSA